VGGFLVGMALALILRPRRATDFGF